jgi:hypothetical protein
MRVRTGSVPATPVAVIPKRSIKQDSARSADGSIVQVIRNEFENSLPVQIVTNLPVQVLGEIGPDRVQVTGRFRPSDSLVVATSSPLLAGTMVKFPEGAGSRGTDATLSGSGGGAPDGGASTGRGSAPKGRSGGAGSNSNSKRARNQQNPPGRQSNNGSAPF